MSWFDLFASLLFAFSVALIAVVAFWSWGKLHREGK